MTREWMVKLLSCLEMTKHPPTEVEVEVEVETFRRARADTKILKESS